MISAIVAMAKNGVIGKSNSIPWLLRADLVRLKKLTIDKTVILGRNTYESMVGYYEKSGRQMPGERYIVITSQDDYQPVMPKAQVANSPETALTIAKNDDAFIIGGAQTYQQLLPFTDRIYLTEVDAEIAGDTYFPVLAPHEWAETARQSFAADEKNSFNYSFVTLERV